MTVYLDLVILLNFLVDLLLIFATDTLTGHPSEKWRVLLASVIGGIYGGLCMIPGCRHLGTPLGRLFILVIIATVSYGINHSLLQRGTVFVFLCMCLGGICTAVGTDSIVTLIFCAGLVYILCKFGFYSGIGHRKYVNVHLMLQGKEYKLTALVDTGNILTDPITGTQVMIAGADAAKVLLGLSESQLRDPVDTIQNFPIPGLRLIPYRSVGNPSGLLLAAKMDAVRIDGIEKGSIVAFIPDCFRKEDAYQALAGGVL